MAKLTQPKIKSEEDICGLEELERLRKIGFLLMSEEMKKRFLKLHQKYHFEKYDFRNLKNG